MNLNSNDRQDKDSHNTLRSIDNMKEPDKTIIIKKRERTKMKKVHAALIIMEGAEIGKQFFLRRAIYTIGRAPDVDISIKNDSMISRCHARIEIFYDHNSQTSHYLLTDLNSTNHTYVNGQRISQKHLVEGDKIHIGETTLKFVFQDDVDARFHQEIQNRIHFDSLTSLLTKESFYVSLKGELNRCQINGLTLSLLMMDIDFFKKVNDTYGHQAGSFVLSEVGHVLQNNVRDLDYSARYGGEEFIALLTETNKTQAFLAAERLRLAISNHEFTFEGKTIKVTMSIGIAQYPDDGGTIEELIEKADRALYQCKHTGRNKVILSS